MNVHYGDTIGERGNLVAIDCQECKFIHLKPMPIDTVYESGEYHSRVKPDMQKEYNNDAEWWNMVYGDFLSMLDVDRKWLLDVGAGHGHFVRYARRHKWVASGIEADPTLAKANNFQHGPYNEIRPHMPANVISAHWVLEHLPDPTHFIQWCYNLLPMGGLVMLTVPNDFTAIQYKAAAQVGRAFYWLNEHHINYFNRKSLSNLLSRNGFDVIRSYGSWTPEHHLLDGLNYLDDHTLGRQLHADRMRDELAMPTWLRRGLMRVNGLLSIGRDLTVVARRR